MCICALGRHCMRPVNHQQLSQKSPPPPLLTPTIPMPAHPPTPHQDPHRGEQEEVRLQQDARGLPGQPRRLHQVQPPRAAVGTRVIVLWSLVTPCLFVAFSCSSACDRSVVLWPLSHTYIHLCLFVTPWCSGARDQMASITHIYTPLFVCHPLVQRCA